jgi:hypothetical protein
MAASDAARAQNQAWARQPILQGKERLREDTLTSMQRLGTARRQLVSDARREGKRLKQDTRHDLKLARLDYNRTIRDLHIKLQRAIREQRIGDVDLI